jgi:Zn-dependent M28 family amino/carboxypeptidase
MVTSSGRLSFAGHLDGEKDCHMTLNITRILCFAAVSGGLWAIDAEGAAVVEQSAGSPVPESSQVTASEEVATEQPDWANTPELASLLEKFESTTPDIRADEMAHRIALFSDDVMEGRAPGTPGGQRASDWLAGEMERVGLAPMPGGSYFQTVPLVVSRLDPAASALSITGPKGERTLSYGDEAVYWTKRPETEISIDSSELVFIGYGAVAPEYDWNDYEGMDFTGKTVVMLVNDPGYASEDPELFTGRAMTYYGRWTYKFEEAGRQGPDAAIIIHESAPASYGWGVVRNSWTGGQYDLRRDGSGPPRVKLEGWITRPTAETLFAEAGLDFEELKAEAAQPGFTPVPMTGLTASASLTTEFNSRESRNVGGVVRGGERPDEYVLYTAHWDHLGILPDETAQDRIYNGAVDNATGIAGVLEIGEMLAAMDTPPKRSALILAVTAEESGLLGSEYFAINPIIPLSNIVAGINIDGLQPTGVSRDITVVGYGASELEDVLADLIEPMGRRLSPDPRPEAGGYYRSDHISLAKRGVPMLNMRPGLDLMDGGVEAGRAVAEDYAANRYHAVSDEYDPGWEMSGMVDYITIMAKLGLTLAESDDWPNWYEGNEFRALRDAQRDNSE